MNTTLPTVSADAPSGFPRRAVAHLVDLMIVGIIVYLLSSVTWALFGPSVVFDPAAPTADERIRLVPVGVVLRAILAALVSVMYFAGSWVRFGRTAGQHLLGIHVQPLAGAFSLPRAIGRWMLLGSPLGVVAMLLIEAPLAFAAILAGSTTWFLALVVSVLRHPEGRGVHDRWAGTRVVARQG